LKIVIAGKPDSSTVAYEARTRRLAASLGISDAIIWTGQLSPAEMAWTFERCAAFAVTSRAEACPNVALEALSYGAPVVSTLQEPMPEFFGDTAAYYRPEDPAGLALRLSEVLAAPAAAVMRRRDAAKARAAAFPWLKTSDDTVTQLALAARRARQ
jgi:phenylacetate-CoA ligase